MKRTLAAWAPLVLGGAAVAGAAGLGNRVLRPAREARLYVDDARDAADAVHARLAAVRDLERAPQAARRLADAIAGASR